MTSEQEKELIVKNAFEFLKRDDLVLKDEDTIVCKNNDENISEIFGIKMFDTSLNYFYAIGIYYKKTNDTKEGCLPLITMQDNEKLFKLYQTKLNELLKVNNREPIIELTLEEWEERHSLIDYVVRQSQKQLKNYEKMFAKKYITENNEVNRIENCACTQPQDTTDYTIKYDQNKPKLSQFPREAMEAVAEVMEYGARKYGKGTWNRVEIQRYIDAGARHLYAMQDIDENGKECINLSKIDEESGLEHLYHLACNVVYAVALYKRGKDETR